jgi:Na+/melibiose symporter-like transporter
MFHSARQRIRVWWIGKDHETSIPSDKFTCGTLRYTPTSLAVLFGWLLWGDFTMCLMESMPGLLVMQLKDQAFSNQAIAVLMTSIFTVCNTLLNPVISYSSDRYRGRWGRRRPFLMFATPFVTLFLILIPWSPEITAAILKIHGIRAFLGLFPIAPLVLVFGVLIALFQIFNMFISTVYYYLIPDTVPSTYIGRFYGMFRIFGIVAGILFNWFIFGHAHTHMRLLFAIFSLIYFISFMLMCWKVREGDYPDVQEEHGHWFSPIKNYAVECFGRSRYWLIFIIYASIQWAGSAGVFSLFFYRDQIGLTETEIGRLGAVAQGITLVLSIPFGALVDRLGSQKALMIGLFTGILTGLLCFFLIQNRTMALVLGVTANIPVFLIFLALGKWTVDMYPRAQYGQFASAGAMVGAVGLTLLSPLAGNLVDIWGSYYRLCLIVPPLCYTISLLCSFVLYRWKEPKIGETENL